jgi:hypothetical protein
MLYHTGESQLRRSPLSELSSGMASRTLTRWIFGSHNRPVRQCGSTADYYELLSWNLVETSRIQAMAKNQRISLKYLNPTGKLHAQEQETGGCFPPGKALTAAELRQSQPLRSVSVISIRGAERAIVVKPTARMADNSRRGTTCSAVCLSSKRPGIGQSCLRLRQRIAPGGV